MPDDIETERLLMRRWRESDREPFARLNADPQTLVYFPQTFDRQASDALIDRAEADFGALGYGLWALERRDTGEFIGFTGFAPMPDDVPGGGGVEIGWRLARHAWHHGFATESARAAVKVAFDRAGLAEIWSMTAVLNEPSQAVMRRIGMTEVARFDHPRLPDGHALRPHVMYHLARALPRTGRGGDRTRPGPTSLRRGMPLGVTCDAWVVHVKEEVTVSEPQEGSGARR